MDNLSQKQIESFLLDSINGELNMKAQEEFLVNLQNKGVTAEELRYFVQYMQTQQTEVLDLPGAIDICGTGGSGLKRINTSTIAAFVLASLDVSVAKHGNKAASGRFGSFDLLEELGININHGKYNLEKIFKQTKLAFIYARKFHPAMKHFADVRDKIGKPTVFNLLGPLLNPANTKVQIVGTAFEELMPLLAETARYLGKKQVTVVRGDDGLDEITITGPTTIVELKNFEIKRFILRTENFGISEASFEDISGGTKLQNKKLCMEILEGTCNTRHLDLVLVNCAFVMKMMGHVGDFREGYNKAKYAIERGKALKKFEEYVKICNQYGVLDEIVANKTAEVRKTISAVPLIKFEKSIKKSDRDFLKMMKRSGRSLIAEIKKVSPSKGSLIEEFDVESIAKLYERSGAKAISVVTEKKFFGGDVENIAIAKKATKKVPILCKDFILNEYQIYEARYKGADAVLLIAAILSRQDIEKFLGIVRELGMEAIVEVNNEDELQTVLKTSALIIGINN
ncbi:anthranilate phosphoribosyltransferase, partial [Patescibacteria group bacterium]|nr:anthranilate phosphoribosyltransferase [Patescibacteria group bacterium]